MYYSYVEIEYVATSFSPARTDLALKLLCIITFALMLTAAQSKSLTVAQMNSKQASLQSLLQSLLQASLHALQMVGLCHLARERLQF
jgi:hypothetical protein